MGHESLNSIECTAVVVLLSSDHTHTHWSVRLASLGQAWYWRPDRLPGGHKRVLPSVTGSQLIAGTRYKSLPVPTSPVRTTVVSYTDRRHSPYSMVTESSISAAIFSDMRHCYIDHIKTMIRFVTQLIV